MDRTQLEPQLLDEADETTEAAERRRKRSRGAPPWRLDSRSRFVLGLRVDATSYAEAADTILERAGDGSGATVCVATAHTATLAFDDPGFRRLVNGADLVTPDGMPLVWALRALGVPGATRVYGPALTSVLCRRAEAQALPVGFYGGRPEVLDALCARLLERFPGLRIAFSMSPPFRSLTPEEDAEVVQAIAASGTRLLFVGLGCPRQERWMAEHRDALPCAQVGVGAAFDFLSGSLRQAPAWMQRSGLEWLFRLVVEPRRLWRRYLLGNPRFVLRLARQLLLPRRPPPEAE